MMSTEGLSPDNTLKAAFILSLETLWDYRKE